jgi:hypothetical protein
MTKVVFIDPKDEMVIHSVEVYNKESKKRVDAFYKEQSRVRGLVERILIRENLVTIMEPGDEIPIPVELATR